jgi:hypothetical protein
MEERTSQIMHYLGMSAPMLPRDVDNILALTESLTQPIEYPHVTNPQYIRYWGGVFFAMDETYLELLGGLLHCKDPWRLFINFGNRLTRKLFQSGGHALMHSTELQLAEKYLCAARSHLWYISYMLCRRALGYETAMDVFGEKPSAVNEIHAAASYH